MYMFHYNLHVFIFDFVVVFVFVIVFCYFLIIYSTNSFCFLQFIAKFCTVKSFISLSNTIESSRERTLCVLTRRQLAEKYEMAASVQNLPRTNRWQRSAASVDCDRTVAVPATATETLTALVAAAATTLKNESIACASVRVCMCASFRASVCEPAFEQLLSLTNTRTRRQSSTQRLRLRPSLSLLFLALYIFSAIAIVALASTATARRRLRRQRQSSDKRAQLTQ